MNKVVDISPVRRQLRGQGETMDNRLTTPPEPPDPPDMQARITKLEASAQDARDRLVRIEARLDGHEKLFASKEDLARAEGSLKAAIAEAKNSIVVWVVGAVFFAQLLPSVPTLIKLFFP